LSCDSLIASSVFPFFSLSSDVIPLLFSIKAWKFVFHIMAAAFSDFFNGGPLNLSYFCAEFFYIGRFVQPLLKLAVDAG